MEVNKIPLNVQCLLSASARINNYKSAVEELVYNSLDAESTCIAIRIHVQRNWIQVVDNGSGVKKVDFKLLGERYATSKLDDENSLKAAPSKYGYQGQALANIIEVSKLVKITSRSAHTDETWVKIFLERNTEPECSKVPMRPSKGTTVEINGFLFNLVIQKKSINAFNELEDIKKFLKQLSIVTNNVSISLRDDSKNEIVFKIHKNRDIHQSLKSLFDVDINRIQELQVEKNEYKVKAFIGIERTDIKSHHMIYLNNKFISNSNLHRVIRNKFIKPANNPKIVKNKRVFKDDSVIDHFVPFYFLFITCPYYDYDIVSSGNKLSVEFKNWVQINNLIEKLIKFYKGDINLVNMEKNENQNKVCTKGKDTRIEVKKIMERILGNPNKIARVSHMQNGVKGKQVKRKKKKQQRNISLTKIKISPNNDEPQKDVKYVKKLSKKCVKQGASKKHELKVQPNPINNSTNYKHQANKKSLKFSKKYRKCNYKANNNNLIEILKNNSDSLKRRCDQFSRYIDNILKFKSCYEDKEIFFDQINKRNSISTNIQHKIENNDIRKKSTDIDQVQRSYNPEKPMIEKICTYDLLQTIIKSQKSSINQDSGKEEKFIAKKRSNLQRITCKKGVYFSPKLTFESHKYNINERLLSNKETRNNRFISKQSRDNFNLKVNIPKSDFNIKTGKITKRPSLRNVKSKIGRNITEFNKLIDKYKQDVVDTPFSVDVSENDIVEFSKQIRNKVMKDMKSILDNEDYDKILSSKSQLDYSEHLNIGVNLNMESTYTILVDSFYNSTQALNTHKKNKTSLDKKVTYTNVNYNDKIYSNVCKKKPYLILKPESQHKLHIDDIIEPLDICEAIIDSPLQVEEEFNKTFITYGMKSSTFNIEQVKSIQTSKPSYSKELLNDNRTNKYHIYHSKNNLLHQKDGAAAISVRETEAKDKALEVSNKLLSGIEDRTDTFGTAGMIANNDVYNFKLNTRYRFLPKGMSQIFKNCFSKNICSYNMETEYYENIIYNNFMEDVAVNSEVFAPKVQNMNEFATGHIQKVTNKLKKHNADLIFGSDSLRGAKVLGQVDCKFIAAKIKQTHESSELLVIFDQHAVHERIRLETNLSHYFNGDNWEKVSIDTIFLNSSEDEILYLHNHKDKFTRFGLEWTISNNSEILVSAIPEAIKGKVLRPVEAIVKAVKNLILEQVHAIKYQKGNVSLYPQSIMSLVFSEACRYAIKFGDYLCLRECVDLISDLASCKTPFQCAHGRPVMAVMMELTNEPAEYKINMKHIKQFKNTYMR